MHYCIDKTSKTPEPMATTPLRALLAIALALGLSLAIAPAFAADEAFAADSTTSKSASAQQAKKSSSSASATKSTKAEKDASASASSSSTGLSTIHSKDDTAAEMVIQKVEETKAAKKEAEEKVNKVLSYDPADIEAIGNQNESGHSICCPSYACAYADAVLDGTVNDHSYYTCSCCTWTDWGGGGSSFRCVGSDEEVLREAYDQIRSGKPTVVHVSWEGGEHWIALIGYENAYDPDHLALENFIALDPSNGMQVNAAYRFALYGDGCQHISDR